MNRVNKLFSKFTNLKYFNSLYSIILKPEMRILPGSIAFFLFMSIIPAFIIIAIICSIFSVSLVDIINFIKDLIPEQVGNLILTITSSSSISGYSISVLILGIILASNGPHAIILASNTLYGIENSNYVVRRIKALILTIILMSLFFFVLVVIAFGNTILRFILGLPMFVDIGNQVYQIFVVLKWPFAIIFISLVIKVLYTIAPDKKIKSKYVNKGVIFTTVGWILATAIYSYYANNMANYDVIYGSLSSIIVLLIWIYVISYILVIGIAINTNIYTIEKKNKNLEHG